MQDAVAIVLAAGRGERLGTFKPKAFVDIGGRPILVWTAEAALSSGIGSLVVAVPGGWEESAHSLLEPVGPHTVVEGGPTRQASVRAGLAAIAEDIPFVVCHDAARPFAPRELFFVVRTIFEHFPDVDGATPVIPVPDTVKRVRDGLVVGTEERQGLFLAQTPQGFRAVALRDAHARAAEAGLGFTDDAAVLEWAGYRVKAVAGEVGNFKITTAQDLERAELVARELARG